MKKLILFSISACLIASDIFSQNLNVTLSDTRTYSGQSLSNICSWRDPQDGKEYALVGAEDGLSIVDVSNPANVTQITQITGPSCTWREIKTNGNYAYVTTECGTIGLQIVNLTNLPATNLQTATWTPSISSTTLQTIHALHIDNGKVYLYGTNVGNKGAIVADITTNPMAPVYLGKYDPRYVHDGYVRNDTLYAGHIYDGECAIVNMANPNNQTPMATFSTPTNFTHNTWLSANSKICFTTDENNDSYLGSFDVSNMNNITELDRIQSNPGSNSVVHNTHILQKLGVDFAVTSWYKDGFTIVDASHPANLVQVGNYDTNTGSGSGMSGCWGVDPFLPSGTIVASDVANGLYVCSPTYKRACFVEGTIMDCGTGNPLAGALIQLMNPPPQNVNSATDLSDALGQYGVGVVTAGTYTIVVSKQAYVSQTFTVSVTSGNTTVLNVNLCPQTPPFTYTGHVYDAYTNAPIIGADVHIQDSSLIWNVTTNASGDFTIPNMLGGSYDIIVGQWGYVTQCFTSVNINSSSGPVFIGLYPGIYDDFSFDWGWTPSGTCPNAWEMGEPVGTFDGGNGNATSNPEYDVNGDCSDQCYVTDNGGGAVSDHDVDPSGYAVLTSPSFNPTAYTDPYVSYYRWFYDAQLNSNQPNDTMSIYISNGSNTVLLERMTNNTAGNGTWIYKKFKISSFVTPSANMTLSLRTSDAGPGGTIVEGGLDKFYVYDSSTVAVNNLLVENVNVSVYPNPFTNMAEVKWQMTNEQKEPDQINIYDVCGKVLKSFVIPSGARNLTINRTGLSNGIYFYDITSGKDVIASGKLMIE